MCFLNKIVSGGQTGADRAALDTAIKFNIPHGGWIPKGRRTESGPLPGDYHLKETVSGNYPDRTRQNVLDCDGTVIIARGALTGGSALTCTIARQTGASLFIINLLEQDIFEGALLLHDFIQGKGIRILNVAGPRASHDPEIYYDVKSILTVVLYLDFLGNRQTSWQVERMVDTGVDFPESVTDVSQAVQALEKGLTLRGKAVIARSLPHQLADIYFLLLDHVQLVLGLDEKNSALFRHLSGGRDRRAYTPEDAVMDLLKTLKTRLARAFKLSVVSP